MTVDSIKSIPFGQKRSPFIQEVACDHMSYFGTKFTEVGLEALVAVLGQQK